MSNLYSEYRENSLRGEFLYPKGKRYRFTAVLERVDGFRGLVSNDKYGLVYSNDIQYTILVHENNYMYNVSAECLVLEREKSRAEKLFIQKAENIPVTLEGELSKEWNTLQGDSPSSPIRFIECKVVKN